MLLNGILEGTPDLVAAVDRDFRFVAFNQALRDQYARGFGVDLVEGARISEVLAEYPEALARRLHVLGSAFRGEEARTTWAEGPATPEAKWVDVRASPLRDETGHVIGGALIGRDVTGAREAEAALRASQSRFRALSLQAPVGIFETDPSGRCTFVNEAWCALNGLRERRPSGGLEPGRPSGGPGAGGVRLGRDRGARDALPAGVPPVADGRQRGLGYGRGRAPARRARPRDRLPGHRRRRHRACARRRRSCAGPRRPWPAPTGSWSPSATRCPTTCGRPLRGIDGFSAPWTRTTAPASTRTPGGTSRAFGPRPAHGPAHRRPAAALAGGAQRDATRARRPGGPGPRGVRGPAHRGAPRASGSSWREGLVVEADGRLLRLVLENLLGNAWKFTSRRERAHLEFAAPERGRPDRLLSSATTARASTWPTRTSSSAPSSACTRQRVPGHRHRPGHRGPHRRAATAGGSGPRGSRGRARPSTSPSVREGRHERPDDPARGGQPRRRGADPARASQEQHR